MPTISLHDPLFATYAVAAALMILKGVAMSWLTVVRMIQEKGGYRAPEDLRRTAINPDPRPGQLAPNDRVERIRMSIAPGRSAVRLEWDPVMLDERGRPELVARYHIYRYERKWTFNSFGAYEVGVTEDTFFEDRDRAALDGSPVFYKVSAEDAAGNETEKRRY